MKKRLKILLECYSCIPYRGSEPALGWNYVTELAKLHDVHVITQTEEGQEPITAYLKEHPELAEHATFHFISCPEHPLLRKLWPPSYYRFVDRWQKKVYKLAVQLHEKEHFDLAQHVTLAGFRAPGYLWKLPVPFAWGPVGGLNNTPWHILPRMGLKGCLFFTMRNIINSFQKHWGYAARVVAPRAAAIMTSTGDGEADIRRLWKREATTICELGLTELPEKPQQNPHEPGTPLKICWIGELSPRKALPILLDALHDCPVPTELHVMGDGESRKKCEKLAAALPQQHRVIFHGNVPHGEVDGIMKNCHLLCITSMRDDTSTVCLEALQRGLPVIAPDHCGFASVINASCGIKIPVTAYREMVSGFSNAVESLATDEERRRQLSEGAFERCHDYTWAAKMQTINGIYRRALKRS